MSLIRTGMEMRKSSVRIAVYRFCAVAAVILAISASADAGSLGLTGGSPDLGDTLGDISINYIASTGAFTADSPLPPDSPTMFSIAGSPGWSIKQAIFHIGITVDSLGSLQPGGTFSLDGNLKNGPTLIQGGTMLTGNISDFGFSTGGNGDVFEFKFVVTGGYLETHFPMISSTGGIIIGGGNSGFNNTFTADFSSGGSTVDVFAVPTPAAVYGGLLILSGLAVYRIGKKLAAH